MTPNLIHQQGDYPDVAINLIQFARALRMYREYLSVWPDILDSEAKEALNDLADIQDMINDQLKTLGAGTATIARTKGAAERCRQCAIRFDLIREDRSELDRRLYRAEWLEDHLKRLALSYACLYPN
jgi:hypothetical protein